MRRYRTKMFAFGLIFTSIVLVSCGQPRQDKTEVIINKLNLIETQKTSFKFQIEPIKSLAKGKDSIRILELEKLLSDKEIIKRITKTFNETLSDEELNDIYDFVQSSAFEKFFNSGELFKALSTQFRDINDEIDSITNNFSEPVKKPIRKFEPIPVERENGFYATVDYTPFTNEKDIKLENIPSITSKDILEVKKTYRNSSNKQAEISITLTKEGAQKFYLLTKENILNPIAIVIEKQIVSMPMVNSAIMGGKINISVDFPEKEIDKMIEKLREK